MKKILFVCLGNICRSPAAEAIFNDIIQKSGLNDDFFCDSCGTLRKETSFPADERMVSSAKKRKISINHRSRRIQPSDFEIFDYIVAMDDENVKKMEEIREPNFGKAKILKMSQFLENGETCVPDPYCGNIDDFEYVLDLLEVGCKNLFKYLEN